MKWLLLSLCRGEGNQRTITLCNSLKRDYKLSLTLRIAEALGNARTFTPWQKLRVLGDIRNQLIELLWRIARNFVMVNMMRHIIKFISFILVNRNSDTIECFHLNCEKEIAGAFSGQRKRAFTLLKSESP